MTIIDTYKKSFKVLKDNILLILAFIGIFIVVKIVTNFVFSGISLVLSFIKLDFISNLVGMFTLDILTALIAYFFILQIMSKKYSKIKDVNTNYKYLIVPVVILTALKVVVSFIISLLGVPMLSLIVNIIIVAVILMYVKMYIFTYAIASSKASKQLDFDISKNLSYNVKFSLKYYLMIFVYNIPGAILSYIAMMMLYSNMSYLNILFGGSAYTPGVIIMFILAFIVSVGAYILTIPLYLVAVETLLVDKYGLKSSDVEDTVITQGEKHVQTNSLDRFKKTKPRARKYNEEEVYYSRPVVKENYNKARPRLRKEVEYN